MDVFGLITIDFTSTLTIILFVILLFFLFIGFIKGFVKSIVALVSLLASLFCAYLFMDKFQIFLATTFNIDLVKIFEDLTSNGTVSTLINLAGEGLAEKIPQLASQIVCFVALFLIIQIALSIIMALAGKFIHISKSGILDSLLGAVLYGFIGLVVSSVALALLTLVPFEPLQNAISGSHFASDLIDLITNFFPAIPSAA